MPTILVFGVEALGEKLLLAGMFTGVLEPQSRKLLEADENEGLPNKLESL